MAIASIVLSSIALVFQTIIYATIIWAIIKDKKDKGKNDKEEELEKELWEISTKIEELKARFKCKHDRLYYIKCEKQKFDLPKENKNE